MAGALVGQLKVSLGLDGAAFNKGLKNQQNNMQKFGKGMAKVGAGISVASAGIALAVRGQLNYADEMSKAAQKFGVPIETLTAFSHAADMSGVSMESLGTGVRRLSQNMDDAVKGNKTAISLFKDLGIEVKDATGKMRPTEAVLADVAQVLSGMPDGAAKTALAMKLLGKSGADMIPMLNGGASALTSMIEEARSLGLTIDAKTGKSAENFNDNLSRLSKTITGIAIQVMANLAPVLERISDLAVRATLGFRNLSPGIQTALSVVAGLTVVLGPLVVGLGVTIMAIGSLAGAFTFLLGPIGVALAAVAAVAAVAATIYTNWGPIKGWFATLWSDMAASAQSAWHKIDGYMTNDTPVAVSKSWVFLRDGWKINLTLMQMATETIFPIITSLMTNPVGNIIAAWDGLTVGLSGAVQAAKDGVILIWDQLAVEVQSWAPQFFQYGRDLVQGLVDGIVSMASVPVEAIKGLADKVMSMWETKTDTHSPSRVFQKYGNYISEGLGLGITEGSGLATGALGSVADQIIGQGKSLTSGAAQFGQQFEGIFTGLVTRTMTFKDALSQVASSLANMAAKSAFQSLFGSTSSVFGGIGKIFGFANGTQNAPGGMAWVGERGPELVNLPRGSQVFDAQRSSGIAARNQSSTAAVQIIGGDLTFTDGGQVEARIQAVAAEKATAALAQVPSVMANQNKRRG